MFWANAFSLIKIETLLFCPCNVKPESQAGFLCMMRSSTSYFLTLFLAKNLLATWQTEVVISGYWSYWHLLRAPSLVSSALAITTADKFTKIKSIWFRNTKCIYSKHVTAFIIFVFFEWISLSRSNVWKAKSAWSSKKMKTITALRIVLRAPYSSPVTLNTV